MKLSEFIDKLKADMELHGDLPVVIYDDHDGVYHLASGVIRTHVYYVQDVGEHDCVELC